MITIKCKKNWDSVDQLCTALADVPEVGELHWANGHKSKLKQLEFFRKARVTCPDFTTHLEEAKNWLAVGELVLGRRLNHYDGNDIRIAGPDKPFTLVWEQKDYWIKYVPIKDEWRIHVFDGLVIARAKKVKGRNPLLPGLGATFEARWEPPAGIRDFAKSMVKACQYLYGACDIIEKADGTFCALEVNTAPELGTVTLPAYTRAIRRWFQEHPGRNTVGEWPYDPNPAPPVLRQQAVPPQQCPYCNGTGVV